MSEKAPKSEKRQLAEKKRHGSEKERQAAVSAQIGRIAEKLLERSEGLDSHSDNYHHPKKYASFTHDFEGSGVRELFPNTKTASSRTHFFSENYWIGSSDYRTPSGLLRKPKTHKTIQVGHSIGNYKDHGRGVLTVDPESKIKPNLRKPDPHPHYDEVRNYQPGSDEMVQHAAPIFREVKSDIDSFESKSEDKKAA